MPNRTCRSAGTFRAIALPGVTQCCITAKRIKGRNSRAQIEPATIESDTTDRITECPIAGKLKPVVLREARPLANLLCPFFSYSLPDFYNDELQQLPRNIGQFGYGMWIALSSKQGGLYGNLKKSERRDRVDTAVGDRHTDTYAVPRGKNTGSCRLQAKRFKP
jgi:hypothetical protein